MWRGDSWSVSPSNTWPPRLPLRGSRVPLHLAALIVGCWCQLLWIEPQTSARPPRKRAHGWNREPLLESCVPQVSLPTLRCGLRKEWRCVVEVEQHAKEEAGVGVRRAGQAEMYTV